MKDNEIYYYNHARGDWHGKFQFEIVDWQAFRAAALAPPDRVWAVLLHFLSRNTGARLTARVAGELTSDVARVQVKIRITPVPPIMWEFSPLKATNFALKDQLELFEIKIFELHGRYRLTGDGQGMEGEIFEQYGPLPFLFPTRVPTTATVEKGGMGAVYRRDIFGVPWEGHYQIKDGGGGVFQTTIEYRDKGAGWGRLAYVVDSAPLGESQETIVRVGDLRIVARTPVNRDGGFRPGEPVRLAFRAADAVVVDG